LLLNKLKELGLHKRVNIIVTSDHGMNEDVQSINLKESCKNAGINPDDIIIASSGETLLLHVKDHDKIKIKRIVEHLQSKNWVGAIFTEALSEIGQEEELVNPYGFIEGTFSLDLIRANHLERKADIIFNFHWSSINNEFGISGSSLKNTNGKPQKLDEGGGHGNISPSCINNTLIAWGTNFKTSVKINNPSGIVDITPTVLNILKINTDVAFDGRILEEAIINGIDPQKIIIESKTYTVQTKDQKYRAAVQISKIDKHWYVDKGWRTYEEKHDE
jgi:arylsulfatase A-like enzyme